MILDELLQFVHDKSEELEVEGINSIEYWLKKADISIEEFMEFSENRCASIGGAASTARHAMMSCWADAFFIGLLLGKKERWHK